MMIRQIKTKVEELLGGDSTGHGIDHVSRVYDLAIKFAKAENADQEIVGLAALLHDVDDYKLFGQTTAGDLPNANHILDEAGIDDAKKAKVLAIIEKVGYSKRLDNIRPTTLEGKIVSDADMCEAMGAVGILRWHQYVLSHDSAVFNPGIFPMESISVEEYKKQCSSRGSELVGGNPINHFFDKLLKIQNLMLTKSGAAEAEKRQPLMISFLREFFREQDQPKWGEYLEAYLQKLEAAK